MSAGYSGGLDWAGYGVGAAPTPVGGYVGALDFCGFPVGAVAVVPPVPPPRAASSGSGGSGWGPSAWPHPGRLDSRKRRLDWNTALILSNFDPIEAAILMET